MDLERALKEHFGLERFRPGQEEVVRAIVGGRDALVIMPTGGGKSLCFQLPAVVKDGCALVVSPLIALMKDQVDALVARGIAATYINSTLGAEEQSRRIRAMAEGEFDLVYVAPERFRHGYFVRELKRAQLSFVAVDEAHCVSQWGHDFRPDYLRIGKALEELGSPPVCAFTATATPDVRSDILRFLGLRDPVTLVTGFERPNLSFSVYRANTHAEKFARLNRLIGQHRTGIIYCATRKRVEDVAERLEEWGIPFVAYHAGMDDATREAAQNRFISGEAEVAVATNAFGMGIDRADIRFVAHFELPGSVEAYYQEAGRAGRDGEPAVVELFFNYADRTTQDFFIEGSNPEPAFVRDVFRHLLDTMDGSAEVRLSLQDMAQRMGARNTMALGSALKVLVTHGAIERFDISGERIRGTRVLMPKVLPRDLPLDEAAMAEKAERDRRKLDAILRYASAHGCRQAWIRDYFGEKGIERCGRCDGCERARGRSGKLLEEEQQITLRKLLSGVARMSRRGTDGSWQPRYGKGLVVMMLTGSDDQRMAKFGLDRLSTYGILKAEGVRFVRELMDSALAAGLLTSSGGERPLITLSAEGDTVMRGQRAARMAWPDSGRAGSGGGAGGGGARSRAAGGGGGGGAALELSGSDGNLLALLRAKRAQLAAARGGIPAYQIFSNKVLEELAVRRPRSVEEAMGIPGIGPIKARSLLPAFLRLIAEHKR